MESIASLTIHTKNRQETSMHINQVLSEYANLIVSRMGVNVQKNCTEKCMAIIVLILKSDSKSIKKLHSALKKVKHTSISLNVLA